MNEEPSDDNKKFWSWSMNTLSLIVSLVCFFIYCYLLAEFRNEFAKDHCYYNDGTTEVDVFESFHFCFLVGLIMYLLKSLTLLIGYFQFSNWRVNICHCFIQSSMFTLEFVFIILLVCIRYTPGGRECSKQGGKYNFYGLKMQDMLIAHSVLCIPAFVSSCVTIPCLYYQIDKNKNIAR